MFRSDITDFKVVHVSNVDDISKIVVEVEGILVTNVYEPPNSVWPAVPISNHFVQYPAVCIGDFNSHHMSCRFTQRDGERTQIRIYALFRETIKTFH